MLTVKLEVEAVGPPRGATPSTRCVQKRTKVADRDPDPYPDRDPNPGPNPGPDLGVEEEVEEGAVVDAARAHVLHRHVVVRVLRAPGG